MGIDIKFYTIYGWKVPSNKEVLEWFSEIDYKFPEGVICDMDLENIYVGAILYESENLRWDSPSGEAHFTEESATKALENTPEDFKKFCMDLGGFYEKEGLEEAKFITFVNYT